MSTAPQPAAQPTASTTTDIVPAATPKPLIPMGPRGVELTSFEDTFRFATAVVQAGMATKGDTAQTVAIKIQMGAECGLPPMASIQNIAVINGRPSIWGDAMLAVCQGSGLFDLEMFEENYTEAGPGNVATATCHVRRLPDGKPIVRSFSRADATTAGLAGKSGPWTQYPRRMLQLRARSWALRDGFADVLRGMRSTEEERDIIVDAEPVSSLDELTEQLKGHVKGQAATVVVADDLVEQLTDPAPNPPTAEEVLADQARECEEWSTAIARCKTAGGVANCRTHIVAAVASNELTEAQAAELYELANGAEQRIAKKCLSANK